MKQRLTTSLQRLAGLLMITTTATFADDGVLEINQACATVGGCFSGDAAGFPVTITDEGSYRLTSNLSVAAIATDALFNSTDVNISLDLNGFEIKGPATCVGPPVPGCNVGGGIGINFTGSGDAMIYNGSVTGFASRCIETLGALIAKEMELHGCGMGLRRFAATTGTIVRDVDSYNNEGQGFWLNSQTIAVRVAARSNGSDGISFLASLCSHCESDGNALRGLEMFDNSLVVGSTIGNNGSLSFADAGTGIYLTTNSLLLDSTAVQNRDEGLSGVVSAGFAGNVFTANNSGGTQIDTVPTSLGSNLCGTDTTCP